MKAVGVRGVSGVSRAEGTLGHAGGARRAEVALRLAGGVRRTDGALGQAGGVRRVRVALGLLLLPFCLGAGLEAQQKYALVIGNGAYVRAPLRNTVNDATDMKGALEGLGFQVELLTNATLRQMSDGVDRFTRRLGASPDSYGFFYYSGHGVQSQGENFLIPVDADIQREADLPYVALHVQRALDYMQEAGNKLNVVVLDACRDNPFSWARSGARGLTVTGRQPAGSIIVYATSAGSTASDGDGPNGTFTAELLKNLKTPGLEVSEVFKRTGADVKRMSGDRQIPAIYSQFFETAYLGKAAPAAPTPAAPQIGQVKAAVGNLEIGSAGAGSLNIRGGGLDRDVSFSGAGTLPVKGLQTGTYRLTMKYGDGKTETLTVEVEDGKTAKASFSHRAALSAPPSAKPEGGVPSGFVKIPGGRFMMGSPVSEPERESDEGPQHQVTVGGFYMGKYEVTVGEFRRFVNATGYKTTAETSGGGYVGTGGKWVTKADANWRNPYFRQGENHPVTLTSWYDAIEYCNWRSREEGLAPAYTRSGDNVTWNRSANGYRLPTEAEWEYACRAGTTGAYSTGGSITTSLANYGSSGTKDVGSYGANPWGLYDMHGNVWEWCWDWYGKYGSGAQTAPAGSSGGSYRVTRGGSWYDEARYIRSSFRDEYSPSERYFDIGFRLARP